MTGPPPPLRPAEPTYASGYLPPGRAWLWFERRFPRLAAKLRATTPDRPLTVTFSGRGTVRASGVVSTADTVTSGCADVEITGLDHRPRNG